MGNERNRPPPPSQRMAIHNTLHKCVAAHVCRNSEMKCGQKATAFRKTEKVAEAQPYFPLLINFLASLAAIQSDSIFFQSFQKFHRKDNEWVPNDNTQIHIHRTGVVAYCLMPAPFKGRSVKFPKRNQQCHKSIRMNFILPLINANVGALVQTDSIGLFTRARHHHHSFEHRTLEQSSSTLPNIHNKKKQTV